MAKARKLDKRRRSVRNIEKITRTMELIATAKFRKAMDRATAASAFTERVTHLVKELAASGLEVTHPLLEKRDKKDNVLLLVLTSNRGLCGGYNGSVMRLGTAHYRQLKREFGSIRLEVSGKRGISALKFRRVSIDEMFYQFEDKPRFDEVEVIANRYLQEFISGRIDRIDIVYTKFLTASRQAATVETLLPLQAIGHESCEADQNGPRPPFRDMNSCPPPRAFSTRWFRPVSRYGFSSVFSTPRSANRLPAASPCSRRRTTPRT